MTTITPQPDKDSSVHAVPASCPGRLRPGVQRGDLSSNKTTRTRVSWLRRLGQFLGACIMRVCSQGRKECKNTKCWLQPICACARADLAAARRTEARVWLILVVCAAVVITVALVRAYR